MKSTLIVRGLLLAALLLLAACSPAASAPSSNDLAGTNWELQSMDGNDQVGAAIGGQAVTLDFTSETEVGGSGGCNSFGGGYSANASAGSIAFTDLVSTLMACEPGSDLEGEYFAALNAATNYSLAGDTLTITGMGHTLVFISG